MAKERGILFTGPMVKAIQDGGKTQTRRVIIPQPTVFDNTGYPDIAALRDSKRSWRIGDRLYVKETHYRYGRWLKNGKTKTGKQAWRFKSDDRWAERNFGVPFLRWHCPPKNVYRNSYRKDGWYKRSALFMPKEFARLWLEITDVRIERVQDISLEDCYAEGIQSQFSADYVNPNNEPVTPLIRRFQNLWDSLNSKRGLCKTCRGFQKVSGWAGSLANNSLMQTAEDCPDCNGPTGYGWDSNPWLRAFTFKKIED